MLSIFVVSFFIPSGSRAAKIVDGQFVDISYKDITANINGDESRVYTLTGYVPDGEGLYNTGSTLNDASYVVFENTLAGGWLPDWRRYIYIEGQHFRSNRYKNVDMEARYVDWYTAPLWGSDVWNCAMNSVAACDGISKATVKVGAPPQIRGPMTATYQWIYDDAVSGATRSAKIQSSDGNTFVTPPFGSVLQTTLDSGDYRITTTSPLDLLIPIFPSNGLISRRVDGNHVTFGAITILQPANFSSPITDVVTINGTLSARYKGEEVSLAGYSGLSDLKIKIAKKSTPEVIIDETTASATGTYTFSNIPSGETYIIFVERQKIDANFGDFLEDAFGAVGEIINSDTYAEGSTILVYDDQGQLIPPGNTGIYLTITTTGGLENLFEDALKNAVKIIAGAIGNGISIVSVTIDDIINKQNDIGDEETLKGVWVKIRNASLSLLTLGLIIIAFMNILPVGQDAYLAQRMLPKLIIAVVAAYFSYFIAAFLLNVTSAFSALLREGIVGSSNSFANNIGVNGVMNEGLVEALLDSGKSIALIIVLCIVFIAVWVLLIWIMLIIFVRKVMLFLLVAIAPLAFIMMVMPFTETYYKQWWSNFFKWAFIGPAIMFMLWLSAEFITAFGVSTNINAITDTAGDQWTWLILVIACLFLAATLPIKMGNEVYGAVQNIGKKGWNNKHNQIKRRLDARTKSKDAAKALSLQKKQNKLASGKLGFVPIPKVVGRFAAGMNENQAKAARTNMLTEMGKEMTDDRDELITRAKKRVGSVESDAAILKLAENKILKDDDPELMDAVYERQKSKEMPTLYGKIAANQPDVLAGMAVHSDKARSDPAWMTRVGDKLRGGNPKDFKPVQWHAARATGNLATFANESTARGILEHGSADSKSEYARLILDDPTLHAAISTATLAELGTIPAPTTPLPSGASPP